MDVTVTTPFGTSKTNGNDKFAYFFSPYCVRHFFEMWAKCRRLGHDHRYWFHRCYWGFFWSSTGSKQQFHSEKRYSNHSSHPQGSGTVDVTVTTPGGTSATNKADLFAYFPLPEVAIISPPSGPANGGTTVTIYGSGFTTSTSVLFGPAKISNFKIVNDNQITIVSPAGSGIVDVTITSCGISSYQP